MSLAAAIGHVQPADIACEYLVGGSRCDQPRADRLRLRPHETVRVCTAHADELRCPVEGCEWVGQVCPDHGGGTPTCRPINIGLAASRGTSKAAGLWPAAPPRAATRTRALIEADEEEDMAPKTRDLTPPKAVSAYKEHGTLKAAAAALGESPATVRRRMLKHPHGRRLLGESPMSSIASAKSSFDCGAYDLSEVWTAYQQAGGVRSYAAAIGVTYHQARRLVELAKAQQEAAGAATVEGEGEAQAEALETPEASQAPATAEKERLPACPSCGVGLHAHSGLAGTCAEVQLLRSRLGAIAGDLRSREEQLGLADRARPALEGECARLRADLASETERRLAVEAELEAARNAAGQLALGHLTPAEAVDRLNVIALQAMNSRDDAYELLGYAEQAAQAPPGSGSRRDDEHGSDLARHLVAARALPMGGGRGELHEGQDLGDGLVAVQARDVSVMLAHLVEDRPMVGEEATGASWGVFLRLAGAAAVAHPAKKRAS